MDSQLNRCGKAIKFTLIVGNLLFLLLGLTLTALGAFLVHEYRNTPDYEHEFIGGIIMAYGVMTIQMSIIGMVGAAAESWPILTLYIVCLTLATALICSLGTFVIIPNWSTLVTESYEMMEDPKYEESMTINMDYVQFTLKCCGSSGPCDWITNNSEYCVQNEGLPEQCRCEGVHSSKCKSIQIPATGTNLTAWNEKRSLGIAGFAFMCLIQVLGILFSCCMCSSLLCNRRRGQILHESIEVHTRRTYGSTQRQRIETQH